MAGARILFASAVSFMAVGLVGVVVTLVLNAFVFDRYDIYGEVPIPGTNSLQLPAGEVTVNLHTQVIASPDGVGLPVPPIRWSIESPAGVADPVVAESIGGTTTVNNDAHRRVWRMTVPADGRYRITADGQIGGFINPRLAFGRASSQDHLVWVFVALTDAEKRRILDGR